MVCPFLLWSVLFLDNNFNFRLFKVSYAEVQSGNQIRMMGIIIKEVHAFERG